MKTIILVLSVLIVGGLKGGGEISNELQEGLQEVLVPAPPPSSPIERIRSESINVETDRSGERWIPYLIGKLEARRLNGPEKRKGFVSIALYAPEEDGE